MAKPVLKWAGGKRQILSEIKAYFPRGSDYHAYHEPFFGGGAVFFSIDPDSGTVNDINERLMNFYEVVRDHPDELVEENRTHEAGEDYYYDRRDEFNSLRDHSEFEDDLSLRVREASLLLYLNRTCFNGLYRENSGGEFNVPHGDYANPNWVQESRIQEVSEALGGVEISSTDFSYIVSEAEEGDLVYFDPPYRPVSKTSNFGDYHSEAFGKDQQLNLSEVAQTLHDEGVYVVISNSPPMADLYEADDMEGFDVGYVGARRSINSDADGRGEVMEIIASNVPKEVRRERRPELDDFATDQ